MDNNQGQGYYGVTPPISLAEPKPFELKLTKDLELVLKAHGMFEDEQELTRRFEILNKLESLVKEWVKGVCIQRRIPVSQQAGGKIYTFGSFGLGVHTKGADIDTLCVVPRHVDRSDYFTSFYELLKQQPQVSHLRAVEHAFVPVIKMRFDNIEIDMTFARLALHTIPDDLKLDGDQIVKNLAPTCVVSLNGCRATDEILRLVPNIESFRLALRAIKLWAKCSEIAEEMYKHKATWEKLFEPPKFFAKYKHYIAVVATSNDEEDQLKWSGHVVSRLRKLIAALDRNPLIELAHIWSKPHSSVDPASNRRTTQWFIGLAFKNTGSLQVELTEEIVNFVATVKMEGRRRDIFYPDNGMEIDVKYVRRKDILTILPASCLGKLSKEGGESRKRTQSNSMSNDDIGEKKCKSEEAHVK